MHKRDAANQNPLPRGTRTCWNSDKECSVLPSQNRCLYGKDSLQNIRICTQKDVVSAKFVWQNMKKYLVSRVVWGIVSILAIVTVNFFLTRTVPGDPVTAIVGDFPTPPGYIEAIKARLGLDRPLYVQYGKYMASLLQGELGYSFVGQQSVIALLAEKAQFTLLLMLPSLALSTAIGVLLGLWVAPRAGSRRDQATSSIAIFLYSLPVFWFGQLLILIFAIYLGWMPAQGMVSLRGSGSGSLGSVLDIAHHMVLPSLCIVIAYGAVVLRVARASIISVLKEDFVVTARAKGLTGVETLFRHVLPNASVPIITVVAYQFGYALTGSIFVETVFAWPGLGSAFLSSISSRDYPVLQGLFLFSAIIVVTANIAADLACSMIDPRVRRSVTNEL